MKVDSVDMVQNHQVLKVVLAAVHQLPPKLQQQLAAQLLREFTPDQHTAVVSLQRLAPQKHMRLARLMDKHNDGRLNQTEQKELQRLGGEVNQLVLTNSQVLARALRPELFDERGRPLKQRFRQALSESSVKRADPRPEHGRK
jgi:hypothetical protein